MKYQRIQDLRIDSDLSQKQLGEILHISQRSYSHYETGSRGIPVEMLIRLADYYDTTIDYLVGRTDNKEPGTQPPQTAVPNNTPKPEMPKAVESTPEPKPAPTQQPTPPPAEETPKVEQPQETTPAPEEPAVPEFNIQTWIDYAKTYAVSVGLRLESSAVDCWDNPITAGAYSTCLERDIAGRLDRYSRDEDITDVWIWAQTRSDGSYDLYIGYA